MSTIATWMDPALAEPETSWVQRASDAMRRHVSGGQYANFLGNEGHERVKAAYGPEKYARLAALKSVWDPTNLFRINQNIRPSS
ncbi:MAG TPA: BBE domain-containing protein [Actinomycetota bacterium]|nr:BBE domain-containing protein [Actinomycetota bacterium]